MSSSSRQNSATAAAAAANSSGGGLTYAIGARTDRGMHRSANEDAVALLELPGVDTAFVLADGMGGLRAGDIASGEVVRVIRDVLHERLEAGDEPLAAMDEAIRKANAAVNALARPEAAPPSENGESGSAAEAATAAVPSNALMGSTCVVGIVRGGVLHLAHVGDSRAYLYRDGLLYRLTEDHSFVAERVRAGDMTEAEARTSRFRNMITRAVGIDIDVQPDFRSEPLRAGDMVLACSDGLTTMLTDDEIAGLLSARTTARLPAERAASGLVDAANKKGGEDNITVVLLRAYEPGQENALAAPTSPVPASLAPTAGAQQQRPQQRMVRPGGSVIDMDTGMAAAGGGYRAPRTLTAVWPLVTIFAVLGAAAAILAGALAATPALRTQAAALLTGAPAGTNPDGSGGGGPATPIDFARLTYEKPADFGAFAARGDLLSYSPGAGLYFVAESSGKVVRLNKDGEPVQNVEDLTPAPPVAPPISDTHVFLTTDAQGNSYFSFTRRKVIEKRGLGGQLLAKLTGFAQPEAVAVDELGNLYVVDLNTVKVLRAHPAGWAPEPTATPVPTVAPSVAASASTPGVAASASTPGGASSAAVKGAP